jgi:hypothetical protein
LSNNADKDKIEYDQEKNNEGPAILEPSQSSNELEMKEIPIDDNENKDLNESSI